MNTLKTNYCYESSGKQNFKEVDLNILKQYSLNEIQLIFVMNFMMPIDPIGKHFDEYHYTRTGIREACKPFHENDKIIKLEHEQVLSLFPSKNTFYDTVKKLISKDIIKRVGRNRYALPKSIFKLSDNGGTFINLFKEFNNYPFEGNGKFEDQEFPEHDDDRFFDGTFDGYYGYYPEDQKYPQPCGLVDPQFKVVP